MYRLRKIVLSAVLITALLLVNLCPAAAAAGISTSAVPSEDISPVTGDGYTATPSDLTMEKLPVTGAAPGDEMPPDTVWEEAATFEELMHLAEAMSGSGGTIRATADLVVPVEEYVEYSLPRNSNDNTDSAILVDMGEHTLYVEGKLLLQTGVTLIGKGSENGLVRIKTGGEALIHDATLQAESGYTVWQEEGALFTHTSTSDEMGQVHYAKSPVAVPDSYTSRKICLPVAVVLDQQEAEDVLPKTDSVCLYQNGLADYGPSDDGKEISVSWDLEQYREQLAARERVLITGSYPDAVAFAGPTCLVVFQNGNPAIFLDCWGTESYGRPGTKVKVKLMKPEPGCRFEWSQDGKNWLAADAKQSAASSDGQLDFNVTFPQDVPPSYPYYLSAVVDDPDGGAGYSDIIVIRECSALGDNGDAADTLPCVPAAKCGG